MVGDRPLLSGSAVPARGVRPAGLVAHPRRHRTSRRRRRRPRRSADQTLRRPHAGGVRRRRTRRRPGGGPRARCRGRPRRRRHPGGAGRERRGAATCRDFSVRYVDDDGAPSADGAWDAAVDAAWRFRGLRPGLGAGRDRRPPGRRRRPGRARRLRRRRRRSRRCGSPARSRCAAPRRRWWSSRAGPGRLTATPRAPRPPCLPSARCCRDWRRGLVVEVPASTDALEQALGAADGDYDQIAAVTTSADGSSVPDAPVHVFVNPEVFGSLQPTGAQVVMSHEATHVADRRLGQPHAAVAARGLRRLRGAARRRPAGRRSRRPRSSPPYAQRPAAPAPGRRGVRDAYAAARGDVRERLAGLQGARRAARRGGPGRVLPRRRPRSAGRCRPAGRRRI